MHRFVWDRGFANRIMPDDTLFGRSMSMGSKRNVSHVLKTRVDEAFRTIPARNSCGPPPF